MSASCEHRRTKKKKKIMTERTIALPILFFFIMAVDFTYVFSADLPEYQSELIFRTRYLFDARFAVIGQSGQDQHHVHSYGRVHVVRQREHSFHGTYLVQTIGVRRFRGQFRYGSHEFRLAFGEIIDSYSCTDKCDYF